MNSLKTESVPGVVRRLVRFNAENDVQDDKRMGNAMRGKVFWRTSQPTASEFNQAASANWAIHTPRRSALWPHHEHNKR